MVKCKKCDGEVDLNQWYFDEVVTDEKGNPVKNHNEIERRYWHYRCKKGYQM
jgi:hypothetical protein